MINSLILRLIGDKTAGRLDYFLNRKSKDAWGALNGQTVRQKAYKDIIGRISFRAIVETGTYRGTTSDYFATTSGLPVYTVEVHPRCYGYSMERFAKDTRVHAYQGDSPKFLRELAEDTNVPKSNVFFYLDAHVQDSSKYHKAPLLEELEIIFENWKEAVVMVDDFQVPGSDYGFDDWGSGKTLNVEIIHALKPFGVTAFFPSVPAMQDTGAKRGWVVVCREQRITKILEGIENIKAYSTLETGVAT